MGDNDGVYANELRAMLRPFVFRRYIDFSVIQSLRNMKGMIAREVRRRGLTDNIKLGADRLRAAGRHRLPAANAARQSPSASATARAAARPVRDRRGSQSINDEQTQTLPQDELNRARLAWGMRVADWQTLSAQLEEQMRRVRRVFNELIGMVRRSSSLRKSAISASTLRRSLSSRCASAGVVSSSSSASCQVLDQLMPHLLSEVCSRADAPLPLARITPLLTGIVTRTTYLELLSEFPGALKHLISLCAASLFFIFFRHAQQILAQFIAVRIGRRRLIKRVRIQQGSAASV
jgi:glutamate-ammonia-ligase adenylyltransferase